MKSNFYLDVYFHWYLAASFISPCIVKV